MRSFETIETGDSQVYGTIRVEEAEIVRFAREFDPQPMHLDAGSPQAQSVGGLIASGWHTCALNMRILADGFLKESLGMGSPGVESVRWLKPVRPGDTLTGRMSVLGKRASASKPDRGLVNFRLEAINQHGETVMEQVNLILFGRQNPSAPVMGSEGAMPRRASESFIAMPASDNPTLGRVEEMTPGMIVNLGNYRFEPDDIIRFGRDFDPQPFHLSEEAGRASHFGGLAASGWHTAAGWMRTIIGHWRREAEAGRFVPKLGPSPGFRDLLWLKPVLAGDTLTYCARLIEARPSASRPGWGIATHRNYAINQKGVPVFAFTGTVLWEAKA